MVAYSKLVALSLLANAASGAKLGDFRSTAIKADGSIVTEQQERATKQHRGFKVMTWNILADGVSDDGFVSNAGTPQIRKGNGWDTVVSAWDEATTEEQKYTQLTQPPPEMASEGEEFVDGTMADVLMDQVLAREVVIGMVNSKVGEACAALIESTKELETGKVTPGCCPTKDTMKQIGYYVQATMNGETTNLADGLNKKFYSATLEMKKKGEFVCPGVSRDADAVQAFVRRIKELQNDVVHAEMRIDQKWDLKKMRRGLQSTLAWGMNALAEEGEIGINTESRAYRMAHKINMEKVDIVATQENDHYNAFLKLLANMASTKPENYDKSFKMDEQCGDIDQKKLYPSDGEAIDAAAEERVKECRKDRTFAHVIKYGSNAKAFNRHNKPADNDGSSLFWNKARFEALSIDKHDFEKYKDGGILGVILKDLDAEANGKVCVAAFTTHLPSGDGLKEEQERISFMQAAQTWKESFVQSAAGLGCQDTAEVLLMDGNSYYKFSVPDGDARAGKPAPGQTAKGLTVDQNMYNVGVKGAWKLENFKVPVASEEEQLPPAAVDERTDLPQKIYASVNKIRGVDTPQLTKVGQPQIDRIDYIAVSSNLITPTVTNLPLLDRMADRRGPNSPYNSILPSSENPSDHLPVVANIEWKAVEVDEEGVSGADGASSDASGGSNADSATNSDSATGDKDETGDTEGKEKSSAPRRAGLFSASAFVALALQFTLVER